MLGLRPEREDFKELYFDVKSLKITYADDNSGILDGNWLFHVSINDDMRKSTSIKYTLDKSDEYVENCTGTLSPTGLIIEVNLAKKLDMKKMHEELPLPIDTITLNSNINTYKPNFMDYSEYYMKLHFDNIGAL